jgi:hypothetical protein
MLSGRTVARAGATRARSEAAAPGLGHNACFADLSLMRETKRVGPSPASMCSSTAPARFATQRVTAAGLEATFALNRSNYFVLTACCASA